MCGDVTELSLPTLLRSPTTGSRAHPCGAARSRRARRSLGTVGDRRPARQHPNTCPPWRPPARRAPCRTRRLARLAPLRCASSAPRSSRRSFADARRTGSFPRAASAGVAGPAGRPRAGERVMAPERQEAPATPAPTAPHPTIVEAAAQLASRRWCGRRYRR